MPRHFAIRIAVIRKSEYGVRYFLALVQLPLCKEMLIVSKMDPKGPWSREAWKNTMESFGLPLEEQPAYNRCALWVEMNKIYSDFGENIAELIGKTLSPTDKDIIAACYKMALKNLKDKDGVYNIRKYFGV